MTPLRIKRPTVEAQGIFSDIRPGEVFFDPARVPRVYMMRTGGDGAHSWDAVSLCNGDLYMLKNPDLPVVPVHGAHLVLEEEEKL